MPPETVTDLVVRADVFAVPDPAGPPIPRGYSETVLASIKEVDEIDSVDNGRALLNAAIGAYRAKGRDATELKAARMFCAIRLGQLLGPAERGGDRRSGDVQVRAPDLKSVAKQRVSEIRGLAWRRNGAGWVDVANTSIELVRAGHLSEGRVLRQLDEAFMATSERQETPEIRIGDFRVVLADIAADSVDLILTDPPYPAEYLPLWSELGLFAARTLKPGGSLIAYSGQAHLPEVMNRLNEHLRYWWTLALLHGHGSQNLQGKRVTSGWKPILWFVKDTREGGRYLADRIDGTAPRKTLHEWAQGRNELLPIIESLTLQDELIIDPFAGSGTTGYAALALGRRFIGANDG